MKTALTAGNVQQGAVNGRHPEIGRTSVKHHAEGLRRGSQGDVAIVLCLVKHKKGLMTTQTCGEVWLEMSRKEKVQLRKIHDLS